MFIVMKERPDGTLVASYTPKIHPDKNSAIMEAERLVAKAETEADYLVFKAVTRSRRITIPVETVDIV